MGCKGYLPRKYVEPEEGKLKLLVRRKNNNNKNGSKEEGLSVEF